MSGISPTQLLFEFISLAAVFGILKLFFWNLMFKDNWNEFKENLHKTAESLRENDKHKKK